MPLANFDDLVLVGQPNNMSLHILVVFLNPKNYSSTSWNASAHGCMSFCIGLCYGCALDVCLFLRENSILRIHPLREPELPCMRVALECSKYCDIVVLG